MEKMAWDDPKWGQEDFFPTKPDLADILGRTDLNFESLYFLDLLDPNFLDFQFPRYPNSQIFPDFQTPPALVPPDPEELSDPNLTPLPTHPGIKYVARALAAISNRRTKGCCETNGVSHSILEPHSWIGETKTGAELDGGFCV